MSSKFLKELSDDYEKLFETEIGYDIHLLWKYKGPTIWIAKIKNSTKLIGGYNPLDWNGDCWKSTRDSFLFSFADWKNISNTTTKLSYIDDEDYAV
ncbi:unnamed protein product [Rhizophagus irregularis]|nr:hypothetical protein RhiirC2_788889 [Rhizophagus irregularis]CAB4379622.1 unnamed protein product [Rhizophagus irregularis]